MGEGCLRCWPAGLQAARACRIGLLQTECAIAAPASAFPFALAAIWPMQRAKRGDGQLAARFSHFPATHITRDHGWRQWQGSCAWAGSRHAPRLGPSQHRCLHRGRTANPARGQERACCDDRGRAALPAGVCSHGGRGSRRSLRGICMLSAVHPHAEKGGRLPACVGSAARARRKRRRPTVAWRAQPLHGPLPPTRPLQVASETTMVGQATLGALYHQGEQLDRAQHGVEQVRRSGCRRGLGGWSRASKLGLGKLVAGGLNPRTPGPKALFGAPSLGRPPAPPGAAQHA